MFDCCEGETIPEDLLKNILKTYDLSLQQLQAMLHQLSQRKIKRLVIRNYLYQKSKKAHYVFWLLRGSVQIFYPSHCPYKNTTKSLSQEKDSEQTMRIFQSSNKLFAHLETPFDFINDEVAIQYYQLLQESSASLESKRASQNEKSFNNKLNQSSDSVLSNRGRIQNIPKNRYSAIATSSELFYLELSLDEALVLLKTRLRTIKQKEMVRQHVIAEQNKSYEEIGTQSKKKQLFEKLLLPQISLKNIHPANEIVERHQKYSESQSQGFSLKTSKDLVDSQQKDTKEPEKQNKESEKDASKSVIRITGLRHSKASTSIRSPTASDKIQQLISQKSSQNSPALNDYTRRQFDSQFSLFNQNQQILQRYRSRNAFEAMEKNQIKSHSEKKIESQQGNPFMNTGITTKSSHKASPSEKKPSKRNKNERIFKEHLKGIIRRKLHYEKEHGGILKAFLNQDEVPNYESNQQFQYRSHKFNPNPESHADFLNHRGKSKGKKVGLKSESSKNLAMKSHERNSRSLKNLRNPQFNSADISPDDRMPRLRGYEDRRYIQKRSDILMGNSSQDKFTTLKQSEVRRLMLQRINKNQDNIDRYFKI